MKALVDAGERLIPFLCECADETCAARVELTGSAYRDLHGEEGRFVILRGHPVLAGQVVEREHGPYHVVRAVGE